MTNLFINAVELPNSEVTKMYEDLYISRDIRNAVLVEEWKPVEITEGKLEISNTGFFRNAETGEYPSMQVNWNGYIYIMTRIGGKLKKLYAHREVAKAFMGVPFGDRSEIDHIHGKSVNSVLSLQFVTSSENKRLSYLRGERKSKLSYEDAQSIRSLVNIYTRKELAQMYGVSITTIHDVLNNKTHQVFH
ncbi:hypothetical protein OCD65_28000 [Bacillus paranthracis]|uniref:NUMOD4 domain-containing protein n=1 Tax=Bacillus cereus group TaxID=86661 RepID=UPI001F571360|nr:MULTISPECIES: NUMOD4 domain-containing protein [Bacillus cereus group]MCU5020525.1 hypothetical protein [Bacillus paranthracis]